MGAIKELLKQPYWVLALVIGAAFIAAPCVTIEGAGFSTHPPRTLLLVIVGGALVLTSIASFTFTLLSRRLGSVVGLDAGLDLSRVREEDGVLAANVGECEIRVINGRIESQPPDPRTAMVLPCNEYFDDQCAGDKKSALGAYVNTVFDGRAADFVSLMQAECRQRLGEGVERQKTRDERAKSFGAGRCLWLPRPLAHSVPVALVSTTTQRADEGLLARISYLFDGMRELVGRLADARLDGVVLPVLGAGHGRIEAPLAFVGLLLAVAEAILYGQGGRHLRRVTVVVFRRDPKSAPEVDPTVVRRALALIAARDRALAVANSA